MLNQETVVNTERSVVQLKVCILKRAITFRNFKSIRVHIPVNTALVVDLAKGIGYWGEDLFTIESFEYSALV